MNEISLHILDIAGNSIDAGATSVRIDITESRLLNQLKVRISDNGCGMNPVVQKQAEDPFFTTRTTRNVGMGIPLLKYHVELCGGNFAIFSEEAKGTTVEAVFMLNHLDRQPVGSLSGITRILLMNEKGVEFILAYSTDKGSYEFDSKSIKEYLSIKSLNDHPLLTALSEMIKNNLCEIGAEAT
jgi:anti-sigma regulatory factor (Ser/Thr protein kinase)